MKSNKLLFALIGLAFIVAIAFSFVFLYVKDEPVEVNMDLKDYRVTLFYANEEFIITGDEDLEKYIVIESEIKAKPGAAYKVALEALRAVPEDGCSTIISENIQIKDVYLDGDTVYVNLSSEGLYGGSLEETYLIGQIVNTLKNSFAEVQKVQFLVDGQPAESLMGHVDATNPFENDLFVE